MTKILVKANDVIPYKLKKRILKTGEGRSGDEIYKRRNRRDYRGLLQYVTWKRIKSNNILSEYKDGYIVWVSPEEYFGSNYPRKSSSLDPDFVLGDTGFIYYKSSEELSKYPPLATWHELYELSTNHLSGKRDWVGEVCFNVKNANPQLISDICANKRSKRKRSDILNEIKNAGINLSDYASIPKQSGIGNYDYDYANATMIENVRIQMLYLALICEDERGVKFGEYIRDNYKELLVASKDTEKFKKNVSSIDYMDKFNKFFSELENYCKKNNLLNFEKLMSINAWDPIAKRPICPLCSRPLKAEDFFKEITQQEGRQVYDNTQREIVLMHVNALKPGRLNHRIYNLAWGHSFCNTIQGDKDIDETINELNEIIVNYQKHLAKKNE